MKAVLLALALSAFAAEAGAVTLANGSFEDQVLSTPAEEVAAGGGQITGWTVGSGRVGRIGGAGAATDGAQSVHLHGGRYGTLSQTVSGLDVGERYGLIFDFRGGRGPDPLSRVVFAMLSTPSITYSLAGVDEGGTPDVGGGWTRLVFYFDAYASDLTLSFWTPYRGEDGIVLDNVRMGVAPLPAGLQMLLLGLGALILMRRRHG